MGNQTWFFQGGIGTDTLFSVQDIYPAILLLINK